MRIADTLITREEVIAPYDQMSHISTSLFARGSAIMAQFYSGERRNEGNPR